MQAQKCNLDVIITSYDTFRTHFDDINQVSWTCFVFDEVHKIKNQTAKLTQHCRKISTRCRIGLTGTLIQNSFTELWTVADVIYPGFFGNLEQFQRNYDNPIKNGQRHDATTTQIVRGRIAARELAEKLGEFLLRRTKACIESELPGKEDNIVFCKLTVVQLSCYRRLLESRIYTMLREKYKYSNLDSLQDSTYETKEWSKLVFPALVRLQKLCNHPSLLRPVETKAGKDADKYKSELEFEAIAYGKEFGEIKELIGEGADTELSGKIKVLDVLLRKWQDEGSKVLLFSNSTRMMDILGIFLRRNKYTFSRIDGSTPTKAASLVVPPSFPFGGCKFSFQCCTG
eukprot:TRINITY_DN17290_c0_g1_i1.p1 TRINITY_DN17290_c0_g1~~TRINITY_DN17290_c0_g1_i1.p1  ORF type:complete len:384 (-),score=69.31 TRINITY_DN17290_c0_g1_i1:24-1052(-)